jgi:hypothetical protein
MRLSKRPYLDRINGIGRIIKIPKPSLAGLIKSNFNPVNPILLIIVVFGTPLLFSSSDIKLLGEFP